MEQDLEIIEAYLDGLLAGPEAKALERRLAEDAPLRADLELARSLRAALRSAKPEVPSRRMWEGIQERLRAEGSLPEASRPSALAWLTRPWPWGLRLGAASAMALAVVLLVRPWQGRLPAPADEAVIGVPATEVAAKAEAPLRADLPAARKAAASAQSRAGHPAKRVAKAAAADSSADLASAASSAPALVPAPAQPARKTEVERALDDSGLDAMILKLIDDERRRPVALSQGQGVMAKAPSATRGRAELAATGLLAPAESSSALEANARALQPLGRVDSQGFWDWRPAALAMNGHDWPQAKAELDLARRSAPEAAERSFAASALGLLSASGAPVEPAAFESQLPPLLVQSAGRWQLLVAARRALYADGVVVRLPGWRSEGGQFVLDLSLDRGDFSPGTRFTRLAGDKPARLLDASGASLSRDEVLAPRGASYSVGLSEVRLR